MFNTKKIFSIIFCCVIFLGFFPNFNQIHAQSECNSIGVGYETEPKLIPEGINQITINFSGLSDGKYRLRFATGIIPGHHVYAPDENGVDASNGKVSIIVDDKDNKLTGGDQRGEHYSTLEKFDATKNSWDEGGGYCKDVYYKVGYKITDCKLTVTPRDPTDAEQFRLDVNYAPAQRYKVLLNNQVIGQMTVGNDGTSNPTGLTVGPLSPISNAEIALQYHFEVNPSEKRYCEVSNFSIKASGGASPRAVPSVAPSAPPFIPSPKPGRECKKRSQSVDKNDIFCLEGGGSTCGTTNEPGFRTAIGCIHTKPAEFIKDFLRFIIAISGGIAFLMMLLGAFQMLTSAGNPETLKAGQDRLTSAIVGLLFVIFSILILQIIGANILSIPGLQ